MKKSSACIIALASITLWKPAKIALAIEVEHAEVARVEPLTVTSVRLDFGQLNLETLNHPAILGSGLEEAAPRFLDMAAEIQQAHPEAEALQFARFGDQAMALPLLKQTELPATQAGSVAEAEVGAEHPSVTMAVMPDVKKPHEYEVRQASADLARDITAHLGNRRVMEANGDLMKAYDAAAPGARLGLVVSAVQNDARLVPDALNPDIVGIAANFIRVEPGTFQMGSPRNERGRFSDETQHAVIFTHALEVYGLATQRQYKAAMGHNPSYFSGEQNGNFPVENLTWFQSVEFANRMSELAGYKPAYIIIKNAQQEIVDAKLNGPSYDETKTEGFEEKKAGFRLATEAEGENFTRAGSVSAYPWGDDANKLDEYAVHYGNSNGSTQEVGLKSPNALGLHDTIGNVYEWRYDRYGPYPKGTVTNPVGPATGSYRVRRGGSWRGADAGPLRSAFRNFGVPGPRHGGVGVRLVRSVP